MLDANGYYGGGIFEGNELRLTDPLQCWKLNRDTFEGKLYRKNDTIVPFSVKPVVGHYRATIESSFLKVGKSIQGRNLCYVLNKNHENY